MADPPPLPKATRWHCAINGESKGPFSSFEIQDLLETNEIDIDSQVWREGMSDWRPLRASDLAEQISFQHSDEDEGTIEDEGTMSLNQPTTARMIDWFQFFKLPLALLFSPLAVLAFAAFVPHLAPDTISKSQLNTLVVLLTFVLLFLSPVTFVFQILGFKFNLKDDSLSYPLYFFRRTIRLSEIFDANCQTTTKPAFFITNTIIGLVSAHNVKGMGTTKRYAVNMSGEFGARRVVFHSKYKRDEFLSLLRRYAPHCRITRWV